MALKKYSTSDSSGRYFKAVTVLSRYMDRDRDLVTESNVSLVSCESNGPQIIL